MSAFHSSASQLNSLVTLCKKTFTFLASFSDKLKEQFPNSMNDLPPTFNATFENSSLCNDPASNGDQETPSDSKLKIQILIRYKALLDIHSFPPKVKLLLRHLSVLVWVINSSRYLKFVLFTLKPRPFQN